MCFVGSDFGFLSGSEQHEEKIVSLLTPNILKVSPGWAGTFLILFTDQITNKE